MATNLNNSASTLHQQSMLTLLDFSAEEIKQLLELAAHMKKNPSAYYNHLAHRSLGMIFENASTRTRVSFEVAMTQMGGHSLFLSPRDMQIGRGEPIQDTAKVLSRYVDALMIRTNDHGKVEALAEHADVPVINALTDLYHPCQALADLLTVQERKGSFEGLKSVFIGDGNNVAHSWIIASVKMGMDAVLAAPEGYGPDPDVWKQIEQAAEQSGASVTRTKDPEEAAKGADVIYTDVWTSMGYEEEQAKRLAAFKGFMISEELTAKASEDYMFLHCLPAHREEEVAASVIDGPHSAVYEEAENRLHVQKAILASVIG